MLLRRAPRGRSPRDSSDTSSLRLRARPLLGRPPPQAGIRRPVRSRAALGPRTSGSTPWLGRCKAVPTMPSRPPFIVSAADVPETRHRYPNSDESMAPKRAIGRTAGLRQIGIHQMRLLPGTRTSWPHAESLEEEFVYVISGEVDAWIDGELFHMKAGDLAAFPSG